MILLTLLLPLSAAGQTDLPANSPGNSSAITAAGASAVPPDASSAGPPAADVQAAPKAGEQPAAAPPNQDGTQLTADSEVRGDMPAADLPQQQTTPAAAPVAPGEATPASAEAADPSTKNQDPVKAASSETESESAALDNNALLELIAKAQAGEPVISDLVQALVELAKNQTQFPKQVDEINLEQPGFRTALGEKILAAASDQFATRSSADLLGLKKLAQKFLEPTDVNQRAIIRLFALVERCEHLSATQNILDLVELRKTASTQVEAALLERFVSKAIIDKVDSLLNLDSPGKALRVLAETEPDLRSNTIAKLGQRCLESISQQIDQNRFDSNDWPFKVPKVKELVDWLMARDKGLSATLGHIYTWPLLMAVKNNDGEVAREMYTLVLALRPDPNQENDTLRLAIALSAKGRDAQRFAAERIAELSDEGKLSWSDKLKLLGSGYYGFMSSIFLSLAIVGILCALFFILFRPLMKQRRTAAVNHAVRPKNLKGYQIPYEEEDEYSKLLAIFELTDEATEDDIKKAFRAKVKEIHPDSQGPGAVNTQNQEFIDLRKNYDRIIEIRKSWFGA